MFEKNDRIGGLLRYGIPNFKMEKHLIDRRLEQMRAEGVKFETNAHVGGNVPVEDLRREFDAILLAGGAEQPRNLNVPGRELKGIHFAMEFLPQQNSVCEGDTVPDQILATGKHVIIIGGGDTGADCLGTSHRQGARSVTQFELLPKPPDTRSPLDAVAAVADAVAHRELARRGRHARLERQHGEVHRRRARQREAAACGARDRRSSKPIPGTEFTLDADLVLLAMGFTGPVKNGMIEQLGVALDRARQCGGGRRINVERAGSVRRGRHAARAIAGGVGDRGRPQGGGRNRRFLAR